MIKSIVKKASFLVLLSILLAACSSSSDVVQDQYIQKRKYRKGFFKEKRAKHQIKEHVVLTEEAKNEDSFKPSNEENSFEEGLGIPFNRTPCIIPLDMDEEGLYGPFTAAYTFHGVDSFDLSSYEGLGINQQLSNVVFEIPEKQLIQEGQNPFDKSQVGAAIFCFFLGFIGVHRFYLGYPLIGFLQIITIGGCGLWALIDFIRILIGDLQPANGTYYDTIDF